MKPSSMEILLSRIKSRRVIEDPADIMMLLSTAHGPLSTETAVHYDEANDELQIRKFGRFVGTGVGKEAIPGPDKIRSLFEARGMPTDNESLLTRVAPYWLSDERVDSDGDIVRQNWDFSRFETNSPIPVGHDWYSPPVGRMIDWKVKARKDEGYSGKALWGLAAFADTEQAESIWRLVSQGFLPAGSVGFISQRVIRVEDDDERQKLGLGPFGLIFDKNLLLEYSVVTLPANTGAHVLNSMKGLKEQDIDLLRSIKRQEVESLKQQDIDPGDELETWDKWITDLADTVFGKTTVPVKDTDMDLVTDLKKDIEDLNTTVSELTGFVRETKATLESLAYDFHDLIDRLSKGSSSPEDSEDPDDDTDDGESGGEDEVLESLRGHLDLALSNLKGLTAAK